MSFRDPEKETEECGTRSPGQGHRAELAELRELPIRAVADGLELKGMCPACGKKSLEFRGAAFWRCFECGRSGDATSLVLWLVCRASNPSTGSWPAIRDRARKALRVLGRGVAT